MPKNKEQNCGTSTQKHTEKNYIISSDSDQDSNNHIDSSSDNESYSSDSSTSSNKKINVKPCTKNILASKIRNMEFSISKILLSKSNKTFHIDTLTRDHLLTIRSIFKSVKQLKNVNFVREKTVCAFKNCKTEIDDLLRASKKSEIKSALNKIGAVDNFESFENILLGNKEIYCLKKKLNRVSKVKKNKKNGKFRKN